MRVFSDSTGYAISALTCLSSPECDSKFVPDIAECSGVPAPYLAKLVRKLAIAGIVISKRGYKGGVRLARPPEEISMLQIADAIEGGREFDICMLGLETCSDDRACPTHEFWQKTREEIRTVLMETSLAEVFEFQERRKSECCETTEGI